MRQLTVIGWALLLISLAGCYSFKGTSIPTEVSTFTVEQFENFASNSQPTLSQVFTERLKDKILSESRLAYADEGDVLFKGAITKYQVIPIAPTQGANTAFNRLEIEVSVEYFCEPDDTKNWTSKFLRFAEYESNQDLNSIEEQLIRQINDELVEEIFRKAFNNW